ncbi:hypothetical protein JOQ06_013990 [Pogonophryne albipinna]|uniref:Rho guanine nucleotide exchange factor 12 n=1 Tax=Pogonophryne albipinna TaxID=1090488 RepID=A0AAD6F6Y9_9TELE|nr:hypothetical protein JOQ06_013990 [Pogonophryne albipinna]
MRAGVQTGDRIIKVNGTLVTHSNHIEVVKLIKSGSYVALTVLGRPPGVPNLPEEERGGGAEEERGGAAEVSPPTPLSDPHTPAPLDSVQEEKTSITEGGENKTRHSERVDLLQKMLTKEQQDLQVKEEEHSRNPGPKLLKEVQEVQKHISLLQERLSRAAASQDGAAGSRNGGEEEGDAGPRHTPSCPGENSTDGPSTNNNSTPCQSPDISRRDDLNFRPSPETEDTSDTTFSAQCIVGNPPYLLHPQIIGAEDDYFDSQQEQINGVCSCFQSLDALKARPAHLAAFLHHVVSQFDPAPLFCYLYADMHKQTSSKESRRFFIEFHSLFLDRTANLKVPVPDTVAADLEKRRLELIPEDLCKQYTQLLQDTLLPELHRNLEDFRQKRSMGLTLAEDELSKLDSDGGKDPQNLERECCCAENILSKIEDILSPSQPTEEEKCQTMQYVMLTYMKHLGVRVKEPRGLEHKRARINFLPKIKKSIKPEKEGEEKVKKPRFANILGPPRRLSRVDSTSVGKAVEMNKQRSPKPLPPASLLPEQPDPPSSSARSRGNLSDGSDADSGHDSDSNVSPYCLQPRLGDVLPVENQDGVCSPTGSQFDFSASNLEQLVEEDPDPFRMEVQCPVSSDVQSEEDQGERESEAPPLNWQSLVSRGVLESLTPQEIKRQEVINELFYTERAHLRMLKVLDGVFHQRLSRDAVLPPDDIKHIFVNLEEIIQLHVSVTEQMTAIRKRSETSVIGQIADDLLAWFSGEEEEKIKRAVGTFCSNQPSALELIKSRKKKDQKFTLFMQEAESNRLCRRLQLKDIIPVEMQRVTKYPLLLENIAKYTGDGEEREKVKKAGECCKKILNHVNQAVKEAENKQRLEDYQRRLDLSSLKPSENPVILELRSLDLTKRKMVHEGPLSWKVNKDKTIELYTLLLDDILVLLQKQDERLVLKFHGKNPTSAADTKNIFSPVIKLNTVLVRPVATDNKSFFVLSMSENGAQIYELMAQTVFDQRAWQCLITQSAMKGNPQNRDIIPPAAQTEAEHEAIETIKEEASKDPDVTSSEGVQSAGTEDEEEETHQDVAAENMEQDVFITPSSKGEEALRTLAMLKQALFHHMMSREEEKEEAQDQSGSLPGSPEGPHESRGSPPSQKQNGDGEGSSDKVYLLEFCGFVAGGGPNLSRQLMTHLRLLQADLQYLKEVEVKYNELQQTHTDPAADAEENHGVCR